MDLPNNTPPPSQNLTPIIHDLEQRANHMLMSIYSLLSLEQESPSNRDLGLANLLKASLLEADELAKNVHQIKRRMDMIKDDEIFGWLAGGGDEEVKAARVRRFKEFAVKVRVAMEWVQGAGEGYMKEGGRG
jgi:hypothetical protein